MKKKSNAKHDSNICDCCCRGGNFWAWCFIIFGLLFLLNQLDILPGNVSIWPIALILLGLYLLTKKRG